MTSRVAAAVGRALHDRQREATEGSNGYWPRP